MDISNNKLKEIIADPIDDREIKHENKERSKPFKLNEDKKEEAFYVKL